MSGFLKALAKVGLVELDPSELARPSRHDPSESDLDRLLAETRAMAREVDGAEPDTEVEPEPEPERAPPPAPVGDLKVGRPFTEIYEEHAVPASPFPAEKLLRVLDGLAAMDASTRKVAVMAMDAADDAWTIGDPVVDAQRKIRVLTNVRGALDEQVKAAEAGARADVEAQESYKEEATRTIRQQIRDLEALLSEELQKAATEIAAVQSRLDGVRVAASSESARLRVEMDRLSGVVDTFGNDILTKEG